MGGLWTLLLSQSRRLSRIIRLNFAIQVMRQLIHFGPWRILPKYLIRKFRPAYAANECAESLLGILDPNAIASEVRDSSVAIAGVLPAAFIARLRRTTDRLPYNEYHLVHQVDDDVLALTKDPGVQKVLRAYLQCEPVLLEASLFVTGVESNHPPHDQHSFHFDYAGWESLNVFVYLTDVTENSSYHIVAKGSHRNISFGDVLRGSLTNEEGAKRFGDTIEIILGSAGTLFFENVEAFHRRHQGSERRVLLNLLFASHRGLLSHGRATRNEIETRNRIYAGLSLVNGSTVAAM